MICHNYQPQTNKHQTTFFFLSTPFPHFHDATTTTTIVTQAPRKSFLFIYYTSDYLQRLHVRNVSYQISPSSPTPTSERTGLKTHRVLSPRYSSLLFPFTNDYLQTLVGTRTADYNENNHHYIIPPSWPTSGQLGLQVRHDVSQAPQVCFWVLFWILMIIYRLAWNKKPHRTIMANLSIRTNRAWDVASSRHDSEVCFLFLLF